MALLPRALRPSVLLRRKAMYSGLFGNSTFWKVAAVWLFGRSTLKKFFGRSTEVVQVTRFGPGHVMQIVTERPPSRRELARQRRAGVRPTIAERKRRAQRLADSLARR